jgi:hypothetical protein
MLIGITLDEDNNEMFVNDVGKILVYDLFGNFKRSFNHIGDNMSYRIYNFDKDHLIHVSKDREGRQQHIIISKHDGSLVKTIEIPYKEVKSPISSRTLDGGMTVSSSYNYNSIIPYQNGMIVVESSSDTLFKLLSDYSITPFILRTPSIQSMETEVFLFPFIFTERYCFMESFRKEGEFPRTNLMYDKQEKLIYTFTLVNADFSTKRFVNISFAEISYLQDVAFWQKLEAYELIEANEKGELKGKLKEVAAELNDDSNPVIMLIKYRK